MVPSVMKLVFLTTTLASVVLATPARMSKHGCETFSPEKVELHDGSPPVPEGWFSNLISKIQKPSTPCEKAYKQAYRQKLSYYNFEPSNIKIRKPYDERTHMYSKFWTKSWEKIYSKCYYALEELVHNGRMATELLHKYGCYTMGNILKLGDIEYDKAIVEELLKRQKEENKRDDNPNVTLASGGDNSSTKESH